MTNKIKELVEQAGFSFKYKTAPDELNPGHKLQDLEKFAELIVRECATLAYDGPNGILEHFGLGVEDDSN